MTRTVGPPATPDAGEVARICRIADPAIRNLEITHCYARLSAAMAARTGACANWCTFATWASRQAGRTIRGEDLMENLGRRLRTGAQFLHPIRSLWRWLLRKGVFQPATTLGALVRDIHTPFDALERASAAVARGNLEVFEEIGAEFARYLTECPEEAGPGSPAFERLAGRLRPGDPPEGQQYLRQAFARYQQQRAERDPSARAALVLLANLEIGFHEQTRLQPEIRAALDAPAVTYADLKHRVLLAASRRSRVWRLAIRGPVATLLAGLAAGLQRYSATLARQVITDAVMVLSLPGDTVLPLGRHLDAPGPQSLRRIDSPELLAFLGRFEPASPAVDDCGARDWSALEQRMHYIAHLFRAYHEHAPLMSAPFTDDQVLSFQAGRLPPGTL